MNNIPLVVSILGVLLILMSIRLNSVIKSKSVCLKSNSIQIANNLISVVGIVLFGISFVYFYNQVNSNSMLYLILILSIVSVLLFAFVSKELKKCNASLSNLDSGIVLCVFVSIIAEFILIGKKLYDNKQQLPSLRASSPNRASYVDPFGLDF